LHGDLGLQVELGEQVQAFDADRFVIAERTKPGSLDELNRLSSAQQP